MNTELAIQQLEKNGHLVWDEFLSPDELASLQDEFQLLREAGKFKRAGIGKGDHFHLNDEVRRDETCWTNPVLLFPKLEELKNALNQQFFLGLWEFEGHYAYYPSGGHYQAHLDRFSKDDARTISMVLYLNSDWKPENGGELRIFPKDSTPQDIAPLGGRLVCFFSADLLHEVLPAKQARMSYAGWWKRRTNQ